MVNMIEAAETSLRDRGRWSRSSGDQQRMRLWIDLANSPHVPFFKALAKRFVAQGHEIEITAREFAETVPLARRGVHAAGVGVHGGRACLEKRELDESRVGACRWARKRDSIWPSVTTRIHKSSRARRGNQDRHDDGLRASTGEPSRVSFCVSHHRSGEFSARRVCDVMVRVWARCAVITARRRMFTWRTFSRIRRLARGCVSLASTRIMCWS